MEATERWKLEAEENQKELATLRISTLHFVPVHPQCARFFSSSMGCFSSKPSGANGGLLRGGATLKFNTIKDKFETIEEVQEELRKNGLEASQLIVGLDFTKVG